MFCVEDEEKSEITSFLLFATMYGCNKINWGGYVGFFLFVDLQMYVG